MKAYRERHLSTANDKTMNEKRQHPEIRKFVDWAGSQTRAAKLLGISNPYLSQLINCHRSVSPEIAEKAEQVSRGRVSRIDMVWPQDAA